MSIVNNSSALLQNSIAINTLAPHLQETFDCLRTMDEWDKFFLKVDDRAKGYKRVTKDMEWSKLFSVILWDLPEVTAAESVVEKIKVMNSDNHSKKIFNENAGKNARKPERSSQMLSFSIYSIHTAISFRHTSSYCLISKGIMRFCPIMPLNKPIKHYLETVLLFLF